VFTAYQDLFQSLAQGQSPEALFITCSDSRIVPNLITATNPGDLFVLRNVGNIVPPLASAGDYTEAAAIEYAVQELRVKDIIVCGHSGCGAMKAALDASTGRLPRVQSLLRHVGPARQLLEGHAHALSGTAATRVDALSQLNVLCQLQHLRTHPPVAEQLRRGTLTLHGWFFEIDTARLHVFDSTATAFIPIEQLAQSAERRLAHAG
jgi:carbonic anhydrase